MKKYFARKRFWLLLLLILFIRHGARAQQDSVKGKTSCVHQAAIYFVYTTNYDGIDLSPVYTLHYKPFEASAGPLFAASHQHERSKVFGAAAHLTFLPFTKRYPIEPFLRVSFWAEKWNEPNLFWDTSGIPYYYVIKDSRAQVRGASAEIGMRINVKRFYGEVIFPGLGKYRIEHSTTKYSDVAHRTTGIFRIGLGFRIEPRKETLNYGERY